MNNFKFWGGSKNKISSFGGPTGAPTATASVTKKLGKKKIIKGLGITSIIVLVVVGIVASVLYITVVSPAYSLMINVNAVKADATDIGISLQNRDLVALEEDLQKMEKDLTALRNARDEKYGWVKNMSLFKANEFYSDSDRFINAGFYGVDALREVSKVVTPFADAAGLKVRADQEVPQTAGLMEAFQQWVSIMPEVAGQMDGVIAKVSSLGNELEPINTAKYPKVIRGIEVRDNIERVKNTLSKADDYAPDIKRALTIFPRILAVSTPMKRYMIIMQNDKELRPTGGFMTNYATFKIMDGLLQSDFTSKDMYSIDNTLDLIDATYDFPDAPAAYMKYLKVERWYTRDMNASPDFIESMDQFLKFYNMASRLNPNEIKAVDGVIAINTNVIKELLDVTGPVTVNGITYTSENVVIELEKIASLQLQEQANRKKVLGDLMQAMLINVFESDKNLWAKLIEKGVDLAVRKQVLVYMFDTEVQSLVEKYNFAGRITDPVKGDYSSVVSTNLGGDKTNWFVNKTVDHTLTKENNRWVDTVKIKYTYTSPQGDYTLFAKRFKDWVRVLTPLGSEFISVDGSEDGTEKGEVRGKTYFTGYVELGPDESKEMTFKYYLPATTVEGDKYMLTIQKQPGIDKELHRVTVNGKTVDYMLSTDKEITVSL